MGQRSKVKVAKGHEKEVRVREGLGKRGTAKTVIDQTVDKKHFRSATFCSAGDESLVHSKRKPSVC